MFVYKHGKNMMHFAGVSFLFCLAVFLYCFGTFLYFFLVVFYSFSEKRFPARPTELSPCSI